MTKKTSPKKTSTELMIIPQITEDRTYDIRIEDRGLSPLNLDRTNIERRMTKFDRTRYTIQIPTIGGDRKFISHTLREPTSWKFQSLQFDTPEETLNYIKENFGEGTEHKIIPFKKSWIETFHRIG